MKRIALTGVLWVLLATGAQQAQAQDVDDAIFHRGSTFGGFRVGDRYREFRVRIERGEWVKAKPAVEVWLKNYSNTTAHRIQLPSAEVAIKWAATHRKAPHTVVEVRGNQVLWVRGHADWDPTEQPKVAEALLRASWRDTAKYFSSTPTEVLYRGLHGNSGKLFTFKRQYGACFKLPQNASPSLKRWLEDLIDAAEKAGATVERRADGSYRYFTHTRLDSPTTALPPSAGDTSLLGALRRSNP